MTAEAVAESQTSVFDVAEYILQKRAAAEPDRPAMTAMKLQKLVYYCQAWASGHVCPELYVLHQGHFEIEAGFFAKQLRMRSDLGTA